MSGVTHMEDFLGSSVKRVTLGKDFKFVDGETLPSMVSNGSMVESFKWVSAADSSVSYTSEEFAERWNGATMAGTWNLEDLRTVIPTVDIVGASMALDSAKGVAYAGKVDPDDAGLTDQVELVSESWVHAVDYDVSSSNGWVVRPTALEKGDKPQVGEKYGYRVAIRIKNFLDYRFDYENGITFSLNGKKVKTAFKHEDFPRPATKASADPIAWWSGGQDADSRLTNLARITLTGIISDVTAKVSSSDVKKPVTSKTDISGAKVTEVADKIYTGKALTQSLTVRVSGKTLKVGSDYALAFKDNVNAGTATAVIVGKGNYTGLKSVAFSIAKAANGLSVKGKSAKVKASKLKRKAQRISAKSVFLLSGAQGAVSFSKVSGSKRLKVSSNGRVTVRKGTKKGACKAKVLVRAAGDRNHLAVAKQVTVKVKVKAK